MERDEELSEAERELAEAEKAFGSSRYIHRPDEIDLQDGMTCWLDGERVCGGDCMAFNIDGDGPNQCLVLHYQGQIGSAALIEIAANKKRLQLAQDQERKERQGPPPPGVKP